MTRDEWKVLHHSIRKDARDFKAQHGGYPCFGRRFHHNGTEWTLMRVLDRGTRYTGGKTAWATRVHASRIVRQPLASQIHDDLNDAMEAHVPLRGPFICNTWGLKRQIRAAVHSARAWRLGGYPARMEGYPADTFG